jgi:hypothetical protein
MTTCTPIRPFRCWQYRKDSTEPVPEWVSSTGIDLYRPKQGAWVVEERPERFYWYTPAEFQERFRVE